MNLTPVIHPELLSALARAGHGSRVLIADGNYPVATAARPGAPVVFLNVRPGLLDALTVLDAVRDLVPVEAAAVMAPDGPDPDIFDGFAAVLPGVELARLGRSAFYEAARGDDLALVIATGEVRLFGNLLVTIGVVPTEVGS